MVIFAFVPFTGTSRLLYRTFANVLESSILAYFLNASNAKYYYAGENLDNAQWALGYMESLLLYPDPLIMITKTPWEMLIEVKKRTIAGQERILEELGERGPKKCEDWWRKWDAEG